MVHDGETSTSSNVLVKIGASGDCASEDVILISRDPILSDEAHGVLELVFNVSLNGPLSILGIAVNIINIIIFVKQGFSDSVNVSLCALAVSDLGSLLPMLWIVICSIPLFQYSDINFDSVEIHYPTGGLPHSCFIRIIGLITAFITFERCVCIALPLKVKTIITPRRTLISMLAIFVLIFSATIPLIFFTYFASSFHAKRNKTLVGLMFTSNAKYYENFAISFNVSAQVISFIIVIICTVILVIKLLEKSEWRHKAISVSGVTDSISNRDKRVMKMVTFLSIIFIICYFPSIVNLILMVHFPSEYSTTGLYENTYLVSWAIINTIEEINSSVTILVYYNMSSKFRDTFKGLFNTTTAFPCHRQDNS